MHQPSVTRRTLLRATSASAAAAATASTLGSPALAAPARPAAPPAFAPERGRPFRELDQKIRTGMVRYGIPGVAVGVLYQGTEYIKGYGVTNVDYPVPVDGDTLFRIGS